MRLNDIKQEPIKIISYVLLTLLLFYFAIGDIMQTITMTILCMWMCMMPRLTHEQSFYKNKLPKFLFKKDLINKIIRVVIPFIFATVYIYQTSATNTGVILKTALILTIPFVASIIHYIIFNKYESEFDWLMPITCSILTVLAIEFTTGNLTNLFKNLFPMFFGLNININILWAFLIQILIVYSVFRILSILLPGRTLSMAVTSLIFIVFGVIQHYYTEILGMPFRVMDLFNIKEEIALLKILVTENLDITYLAIAGGIWILIVIVAFLFSKGSTTYDMPTRMKSMLCGILILIATFVISTNFYITLPQTEKPINEEYGYTFFMINNIGTKSEFTEEWQQKIKTEADKLFNSEETNENPEETVSSTERFPTKPEDATKPQDDVATNPSNQQNIPTN